MFHLCEITETQEMGLNSVSAIHPLCAVSWKFALLELRFIFIYKAELVLAEALPVSQDCFE